MIMISQLDNRGQFPHFPHHQNKTFNFYQKRPTHQQIKSGKKIKEAFSKEDHQFITIEEFCQYTGLCSDTVKEKLRV
jgi:hypothetical protein